MSNRSHFTRISGTSSQTGSIINGVPQGSVLGATFFLIYINSLCNLDIGGQIVSFADDTALVFSSRTSINLIEKAEVRIAMVMDWLGANGMRLNTTKTKYMHFTTDYKESDITEIRIHDPNCKSKEYCDCQTINGTDKYNYLGIIIDRKLKWMGPTTYLSKKLNLINLKLYHLKFEISK